MTHFSANHVRAVDFGLPLLRDFTRLIHLDVSFTSSPFNGVSDVIKNLKHLAYLDVSGNDFSWYQVFSLSLGAELEHLGMASLCFVHEDERSNVFENSNFDTKWISRFFSSHRRLASLDITYADLASSEAILAEAFHCIVAHAPALTRLQMTAPNLVNAATTLDEMDRIKDLRYFAHFGVDNDIDAIPAPLVAATHLKLNVAKAGYSACHAHFDCMFPEEMVLKSNDAFDDVTSRFVVERVFSGPNFRRFCDVGRRPFFAVVLSAFRRLQTDSSIQTRLAARVSDWMISDMFPPPDDDDDDDDDDGDTFACDVWEQVVELALEFCGTCHANDRFLAIVVKLVSMLAGFLAGRPALFFLVYDFVLKRIERENDGYAALASLLDRLSNGERRRRALDDKVLETLCAKLAALNGIAKSKDKSVGDEDEFDFALYERPCAELLSALKALCIGVPDVLAALVRVPGAVSNLASVTSIWLSYNESDDEDDEDFELGSEYPFSDALFVLVHAAQLSSPVRSQLLSPEIVAMMQVVAKFEHDCVCLSSYLACLFLVDGALRWPRACAARKTVAKRVVGAALGSAESWLSRLREAPRVCHWHAALPHLRTMSQCRRYPEVAAYGLWRLAVMCDEETDVGWRYSMQRFEMCAICEVKELLTPSAVRRLAGLSDFPGLVRYLGNLAYVCSYHSRAMHDDEDSL